MSETELTVPVQAGFATTMAVFFVVNIFGNSLVIWAILTNTKLQSTSNFYLFALAVTDITIGINTMLPALLSVSVNKSILPGWACTLTSFVDTMTLPLSLWILSASSLDRCIMIYKPIKYKAWINNHKTFLFIGGICLACAVVCCPIITPSTIGSDWSAHSFTCSPNFFGKLDYFAAYCFFTFPVPIFVVIASYSIIFSVVSSLQCKVSRQKIRATMTVLAVIVCLLICVLPVWGRALYILFYMRTDPDNALPPIYPLLEMSLHWLLFMHSSINPCIYGLVNPQFQESFARIVLFFFRSETELGPGQRGYDAPITATKRGAPMNSDRESTTIGHTERKPQSVACSILTENKKFLGLKFSTVENGVSTACANAVSIEGESEAYFESTIQNTTNV